MRAKNEALVIIDVQNDFVTGSLAVPYASEIFEPINALIPTFGMIFATRDWHPSNHDSFAPQGGPWPVHCVADTYGAKLASRLNGQSKMILIDKGQRVDGDGYSGFGATYLNEELKVEGIDKITVVGLATDYCVRATVLDALRLGYAVDLVTDAIRGVAPDTSHEALREMAIAGARFCIASAA